MRIAGLETVSRGARGGNLGVGLAVQAMHPEDVTRSDDAQEGVLRHIGRMARATAFFTQPAEQPAVMAAEERMHIGLERGFGQGGYSIR